jgi:GNAT superfamily N-acetyltransferase
MAPSARATIHAADSADLGHDVSDLLETGYVLRHPTPTDAPRVHALVTGVEMAEFGEPGDRSLEDLLAFWRRLDLARDTWIVVAPDGDLAGYSFVQRRQIARHEVEVYVHPTHEGCGIGTTLVHQAEAGAREAVSLAPPGTEVFVTNWINARNRPAVDLLEREGYLPVRYFWRMGMALQPAPPPSWPTGMTVRSAADIADLQPFYEIVEEGMADHWDHLPIPFDQWIERRCGPGFDDRLWFLAMANEGPAGAVLCRSSADAGWVDFLVVRRAYRQQGLGSALLAFAFDQLAQRGHPRGRLVVDAHSLTGATRLYERAGMQVEQEYAAYRKGVGDHG